MEELPRPISTRIQVAALAASDIAALHDLHQSSDSNPWSLNSLTEAYHSERYQFFGLKDEGRNLIGFAIFYRIVDDIELHKIAISKTYQGKGLGHYLLHHCLNSLGGFDSCFLEVNALNTVAIALYQRMGFEVSGRRENYYGKAAAIVMQYKQSLD